MHISEKKIMLVLQGNRKYIVYQRNKAASYEKGKKKYFIKHFSWLFSHLQHFEIALRLIYPLCNESRDMHQTLGAVAFFSAIQLKLVKLFRVNNQFL